ncbi:MAG: complex I NDUFA9 subunit family protein [Verrucomicrobiae bacterium]|nr:complex I NDUFA9 subunit family protein [Verrucomicrobiae bacterium]
MEVALSGGTGFVGRAMATELAAHGHQARLLVRDGRPLPHALSSLSPAPVLHEVDWDRTESLAEALTGAEAVIHLVGIIAECGRQTFERIHTELTGRLLEAALAAKVPRLIHMSALGTRPGAPARYHQTKWAAEQRVRDNPLPWTIFRPSLIYGPGDAVTRLFAKLSRWSPCLPVMGPGTAMLQPIRVENVARAFVRSLSTPESEGRTYELCGHDRLDFKAFLRAILEACGRRRLLLPIPLPIARLQAALFERVFPAVLHQPPPLSRDQLLMLQEDNVGDPAPADRTFQLVHLPFREDLRTYLRPAP